MSKELADRLREAGIDLSAPDYLQEKNHPTPEYDDWRDELEALVGDEVLIAFLEVDR